MRSETMTDAELIESVATRVMGWRNDPAGGWLEYLSEQDKWCWTGLLSVEPTFHQSDGGHEYQHPFNIIGTEMFNPLTDHNHAMQVVEKMRERGWWWSGYGNSLTTTVKDVCFTFQKDEDTDRQTKFKVYAPTLPRAICLSALAAVKGEDAK